MVTVTGITNTSQGETITGNCRQKCPLVRMRGFHWFSFR